MLTNEMGFQRTFAFVRNFTDITLHYRLRGSKGKQKSFFLIGERLLIFSPLMIFCAGALLSHACRKTCRGLNVCSSRPVSSSRQQLLSLVSGGSRQQTYRKKWRTSPPSPLKIWLKTTQIFGFRGEVIVH